jgi:molybdate-binding protein
MRNKTHIQHTLSQIESIQQSFIQFIRNSQLSEGERAFLDKQIEASKQAFDQMRTYISQEEDVYNVKSSRF